MASKTPARAEPTDSVSNALCAPQLEMFELDDDQWLKVYQRSYQQQQQHIKRMSKQLPLLGLEIAV